MVTEFKKKMQIVQLMGDCCLYLLYIFTYFHLSYLVYYSSVK